MDTSIVKTSGSRQVPQGTLSAWRKGAGPIRRVLIALTAATIIVSLYIARHEYLAQQLVLHDIHILELRYERLSYHVDSLQTLVIRIDQQVNFIRQLAFGDMPSDEVQPARDRIRLSNTEAQDINFLSNLFISSNLLQRRVFRDSLAQIDLLDLVIDRQKFHAGVPGISPLVIQELTSLASGFGLRMHPFYHMTRMHKGIDFSAPEGTPVFATADGDIIAADTAFVGYGTLVVIDHGHGYQTRYAHLGKFLVKPGDHVARGQIIAQVGNTGLSTASHLHYEVLLLGVPINPINFLFPTQHPKDYAKLAALASLQNQSMGN